MNVKLVKNVGNILLKILIFQSLPIIHFFHTLEQNKLLLVKVLMWTTPKPRIIILFLREIIESKIIFINSTQLLDLKRLDNKQEIQTIYNKYQLETKINNTEHKKTIKI